MKLFLTLLSIFFIFSCGNNNDKTSVDHAAVILHDSALALVAFDRDSINLISAIKLMDSAIKIQPDYSSAYWNKMTFEQEAGLVSDAINTSQTLDKIRPDDWSIKMFSGILLDNMGDSLGARGKYLATDVLFAKILDTLQPGSDPHFTIRLNYAVNLKLLGKDSDATQLITAMLAEVSDKSEKGIIESILSASRKELLNNINPALKDPHQ